MAELPPSPPVESAARQEPHGVPWSRLNRRTWALLIAVVILGVFAYQLALSRQPKLLPIPPNAVASLEGGGSKTGPPVRLAGNYHLVAQVVAYVGCHFTMAVSPYALFVDTEYRPDPIGARVDLYQTDLYAVPDGEYSLVIGATGCGSWSIWIAPR